MFKLFRVEGFSLYPFLREGEVLLCLKLFSFSKIKLKDTVIFKHENNGSMIKRVKKINQHGYFVEGENSCSIDSRDFGEVEKKDLLYKAIFNFSTYKFL